jgi:hypothetical protein
MKTNLKNMLGLAALGMTLLSNTVPTWAGYEEDRTVFIYVAGLDITVRGSLTGARYNADGRQYIGCSLDSSSRVQCVAQDRADNSAYCVSYAANHVAEIQKMTNSSHISFEMTFGNLACDSIRIDNSSFHLK